MTKTFWSSIQSINNWSFLNWKKYYAFFNLIGCQRDIDKIYLYAKSTHRGKYQLLIKKREGVGLKQYNDSEAFIVYLNSENVEEYNPDKEHKILIVLLNMIADMLSNKKT